MVPWLGKGCLNELSTKKLRTQYIYGNNPDNSLVIREEGINNTLVAYIQYTHKGRPVKMG